MLSILPKQIKDESLASYILRLTLRNGFGSQLEWLDKPTFNAITRNLLSHQQKQKLGVFIPVPIRFNTTNLSARHSVLFHDCRTDSPRLCPLCVKGLGYLKEDWRYIGNLMCDIHKVALTDCCSQCGEQLVWSPLLLQCTCTNELCSCQLTPFDINNDITELFIEDICDCLLANVLLTEPYTTALPIYKHPHLKNFNQSITDGFHLLTKIETLEHLTNILVSPDSPLHNLPLRFQLFPLTLLKHNLKSKWPISELLLNLSQKEQLTTGIVGGIDNFTVTVDSAVELLSIPKSQLILSIPQLSHKTVLPGNLHINIASLITKH